MEVLFLVGAVCYFLPAIVGLARSKHNIGAIFALNLFLGWTLVGWVVALVWALTHDGPAPGVYTTDSYIPADPLDEMTAEERANAQRFEAARAERLRAMRGR